jgi:DUF438 domain-containing protein
MTDPHKLTPAEVHAVAAMLEAVKAGHDEEARFWVRRMETLSAIAKMRAQLKASRS